MHLPVLHIFIHEKQMKRRRHSFLLQSSSCNFNADSTLSSHLHLEPRPVNVLGLSPNLQPLELDGVLGVSILCGI